LGSCYAASAGDDERGGDGRAVRSQRRESPLGVTVRRRAVAAGGIAKAKRKDPLVVSVDKVAESMAAITAAITSPAPPLSFEEVIRSEVAKSM